ncbi:MAG: dihydrofolate reductase [Hydrogenophaga sp.]|uniref:dihydrofolate reductase family protein n=1 Tax=Hydrogenophaga sp. TaxID=1904254 RepID=UPI001DFE2BAD|nr:dihydrofolate reductase family protein [Hydrogenophaga sp.]MBX3608502.1 dihydrofolate reductase [Hydrogenophaga sp.]
MSGAAGRPAFAVFIATSLDGFIARADGRIDWLEAANASVPAGEDCGYAAFMGSVDALLMGRKTFDTVRGFADWPYGDKPVVVLSRSLRVLPEGLPPSVSLMAGDPREVAAQLAARGHQRVYLDGGETIQAFVAAGLVDEFVVTRVPVLIGEGRPLFSALPKDQFWQHADTRSWPFGFVQSRYLAQR